MGLNGCLGLLPLVHGSTSLLLGVGLQSVLAMSLNLPVGGVLGAGSSSAPASVEQCQDSLKESALLLLPCHQRRWLVDSHPLLVLESVLIHQLARLLVKLPLGWVRKLMLA